MKEDASHPRAFPGVKLSDFPMCTETSIPGKAEEEKTRTCWSSSSCHTLPDLNGTDFGAVVGRYRSTNILLLNYLEPQDCFENLKARPVFDVWMGCIEMAMLLEL